MEVEQIARLLNDTLSINGDVVHTATEALDSLSPIPHFPFYLLSIAAGKWFTWTSYSPFAFLALQASQIK